MELKDEFDLEFSLLMREIENYAYLYSSDKSIRIRLNNWIKKIIFHFFLLNLKI